MGSTRHDATVFRLAVLCAAVFALLAAQPAAAQNAGTVFQWSTLAGRASIGIEDGPGAAARFHHPAGLAVDPASNLYIADTGNHTIRKISPAGIVSTLAGSPGQSGSADGIGTAARFNSPQGVAADAAGNLYVADTGNCTIRMVTPVGAVTTLAGQAGQGGMADGNVSSAFFSAPQAIAVDSAGIIYVSDYGIRRISAGNVETIFTSGNVTLADGSSTSVTIYGSALAVDANRQVFFGGWLQSGPSSIGIPAILKMDTGGAVAVFFYPHPLNISDRGADDFRSLMNLAADPAGGLLAIVDSVIEGRRFQVWQIATGKIWKVLGEIHDGSGVDSPAWGLAANPAGQAFFSRDDNVIVKMAADGTQTLLAGTPQGPLFGISSLAADSAGNVWAGGVEIQLPGGSSAPALLKVSPDGTVTTPIRRPLSSYQITIRKPVGIAADSADNIYFTDTRFAPQPLFQIAPTGAITQSNLSRWYDAQGFVADASGDLIVPDSKNHVVRKRAPDDGWSLLAGHEGSPGNSDGTGDSARFGYLGAITADRAGNLYVLDLQYADGMPDRCVIRRITPSGAVSTVSGNLLKQSGLDWLGEVYPQGIAIDSHGAFYLAYGPVNTVWHITAQGEEAAIGGAALQAGSTDGLGSAARFVEPIAIAVDAHDNIYIGEGYEGGTIRKGQLAGPPVITTQPRSQTVVGGGSVQFSVTAVGVPAPTYQWYVNGNALSGATSNTLSFANVRAPDAGDYTVIVTNALGSTTSSAAMLTVKEATAESSGSGGGGGTMKPWLAASLALLATARLAARSHVCRGRLRENSATHP
jgi:sugar lactone lactonase YvrE